MRKTIVLLAALALVAAGCGGDDGDAATTTVSPTTSSGSDPTAGSGEAQVVIRSIDFGAGTAELVNTGDAPYDLAGHWLCNRPNYAAVPGETIAAGGSVIVDLGGLGIDGGGGELGLYSSRDFANASAIVRYVQWGSAGGGRSGTAVEAGVWTDGDAADGDVGVLVSTGDDPVSAADWAGS